MTGTHLVRRQSRDLAGFGSLFDRAFRESALSGWGDTASEGLASWSPAVDVFEDDGAYTFRADLPGLDKKDVNVSFEDNVLTLAGERHFEEKEDKGQYRRLERRYGKFTRSFSLPGQIESSKVDASFTDGVLSVRVPKTEAAKARKIKIQ